MCLLQNESHILWGTKFDEKIREVWAMMEEYVQVRHGKDYTNLTLVLPHLNYVLHALEQKVSLLQGLG